MNLCTSSIHVEEPHRPEATVAGVIDLTDVNGKPPESVSYCTRCATALEAVGWFTPDSS